MECEIEACSMSFLVVEKKKKLFHKNALKFRSTPFYLFILFFPHHKSQFNKYLHVFI